ncbi:MAG TPA: glycosyltransferase [Miltoncostaeaceae bacterium]|nr:glycosyltransferase [Miltoncostaeaceae bacterium]
MSGPPTEIRGDGGGASSPAPGPGSAPPPPIGTAPHLSVVVPCFRQEAVIADNLREIVRRVEGLGVPFEVVLVSDGSPDETERRASAVEDGRVRVISYDRNMGKGYALRTGSLAARGDWIAWVDSDLDLDPSLLGEFLRIADAERLDVVVGSKRHPDSRVDYPAKRRAYSWLYQRLVKVLFQLDVRDTQVGMKLFRRRVLHEVLPVVVVKRYAFDLEILAVARSFGASRIAEAPVRLDYRFSGTGMNWRAIAQALWDTAAVFYRLRLLGYYDRRRVLAHRIAFHRPARLPTVTVLITSSAPGDGAPAHLDAILERLPHDVPVVVVVPPERAPALRREGRVTLVEAAGDDERAAVAAAALGAGSDLIAFVDLDSHPTRHWLEAALPLFGDPMVAAVAGPTVPSLTGDLTGDAAGLLMESRVGMGGARARHRVGVVREVGDFPLRNLFVRAALVRRLLEDGVPLDDRFVTTLRRREGLSVISSPDVVVTTAPPPLWRPHLRRLFRAARARGEASGEGAVRLRHLVPAAWTLALALGPVALRRRGRARHLWAVVALAYVALLSWFAALLALLHRRPRLALVTALGAAASHVAFGAGLLTGRACRAAGRLRGRRTPL